MTRIEFADDAVTDFERIVDHLVEHESIHLETRVEEIRGAINVLKLNPLIGRPLITAARSATLRELVIGRKDKGYVALYQYFADADIVFVLAIRSQREVGYAR